MRINERFNDDALHLPGHLTADAAFSTVYSPAESNSVQFPSTEGFIYKNDMLPIIKKHNFTGISTWTTLFITTNLIKTAYKYYNK